jgi:cation-transporting P-type ATPase E
METTSARGPSPQPVPDIARGLTTEEANARRARGLGVTPAPPTSRSYRQIILENVFTFINMALLGLGVALALLGRIGDALISTGVISLNIVVSLVQEIRAKRTLDRIALLARPTATVLRDGKERDLSPDELVIGDTLKVGPGDQIVVDGRLLGDSHMTMDESLLTGEADPVPRAGGDTLYSGSYVVTGEGYYIAERVGAQSFVNQITASARAFRRTLTPLQREIYLVVRIALLIVLYMEFLLVVTSIVRDINLAESVENSTIVAGLVPNGLFLSIAIAYALGAVRILRFGALVQQSNAIESLSHVDILCFDKTGTLTTNRLDVEGLEPFEVSEAEMGRMLGAVVASAPGGNKTSEAIAARWPAASHPTAGAIPFSSARKWSAVAFDSSAGAADGAGGEDGGEPLRGVFALGAPESLRRYLLDASDADSPGWRAIAARVQPLARLGLRVLLLAYTPEVGRLEDLGDESALPATLRPVGLVSLRDELRPEARETLAAFAQAGVRPKIISGDNPETVAALARQAGLPDDVELMTGAEVDALEGDALEVAVESATIFGRITPRQKERIIQALRERGHYVAMIGDGVNDVLSLKQADLGVAMRSGSQAARGVADIVLMQDSFAVLAPAALEGQRILNGMQAILKLFLTRISTVGLVILSSLVIGVFPLELRQGSILTLFSVGIPTILLAIWAHPGAIPPGSLVRRLLHFILPPALASSVLGVTLFFSVYALRLASGVRSQPPTLADFAVAQTALASFLVFCGLLLVIFVAPPTPWWTGASKLSEDRRPALLAVGLMACFLLFSFIDPLGALFALTPLPLRAYAGIAFAIALWLLLVRWMWRSNLLGRYLGMVEG